MHTFHQHARRATASLALALGLGLLAACGSDGGSSSPLATSAPSSTTAPSSSIVSTATQPAVTQPTTPPSTQPTTPATDAPTTTVARTTTTLSGPPLVTGSVLAAGTHRSQRIAPAFDIITTAAWDIATNSDKSLTLQRDNGEVLAFTVGILVGATPDEVIANSCPGGKIAFGKPATTTVLGLPATQIGGKVSAMCTIPLSATVDLGVNAGETARVTAVVVGDRILVVIDTSGVSDVAAHTAEIDAVLATLTLVTT